MRKMILAVGAAGVVMTGAVSLAQAEVVLTGSELAGLTYSNGGFSGDAAGYVSSGGGFIQLSTGDTQNGNPSQFNDTGVVFVPNGYDGVALPSTLSAFVTTPVARASISRLAPMRLAAMSILLALVAMVRTGMSS